MALTQFNEPTNVIESLPDRPVTDGGLTSAQFKQKFDQIGTKIKAYINETLIPQITAQFQLKLNATNKVPAAAIASSFITSTMINAGAVTEAKIANDAVTTAKVDDGAITTAKLGSKVVTAAKIADGTITATQIAGTTITGAKMVNKTVTATQLADKTVTAAKMADSTITATQLASGSVTTAKIAGGAVTAAKLDSGINYETFGVHVVTSEPTSSSADGIYLVTG